MTATRSLARVDLHFDEPLADAGEVRAGTPLVHRFTFSNDGKEPAEITETRVSCGCLKANVEKPTIAPGERGSVTLEVNTLAASAGPHTWYLYVTYHSGKTTYEMSLRLAGEVITEVSVQPASVTVFAESAVGHEIVLTDLREHPLSVSALQASSPKLRTHLTQTSTDSQGHHVQTIQLEIAPDYPEGRHEEVVDIYTDDPSYRDLRVPVTVVKRSPQRISATPSQVDLVAAPGQEVPSKVIFVRSGDNRDVIVDRIEADDPAIVCQWAHGPGTMTTVRVNIDRQRMQGTSLQSSIRIHVSQPNDGTVVVPITCVLE